MCMMSGPLLQHDDCVAEKPVPGVSSNALDQLLLLWLEAAKRLAQSLTIARALWLQYYPWSKGIKIDVATQEGTKISMFVVSTCPPESFHSLSGATSTRTECSEAPLQGLLSVDVTPSRDDCDESCCCPSSIQSQMAVKACSCRLRCSSCSACPAAAHNALSQQSGHLQQPLQQR